MRCLTYISLIAPAVLIASCAPELNLEPPPDLQPQILAFTEPTATVVPDIMEAVESHINDTKDDVQSSSVFEEILDLVIEVQEEMYNDQGQIDVGGTTFDVPNGGLDVNYICDGWSDPPPEEPDPENGKIALNMRLTNGDIAPLVWGTVEDCRYPLQAGDVRVDALYRGQVALYFSDPEIEGFSPTPLTSDTDPYSLEIFFLAEGIVAFDEGPELDFEEFFSVTLVEENGDVRIDELHILIELPDGTSFVYGFSFSTLRQEITDSTGTFQCSLEERFCLSPSGTFVW